jgi:hypothetical protein
MAIFCNFSLFGSRFLRHEIVLMSYRMILKRPECAVPELFVKWSCLKTEGVEICISAAALDRIKFRTLYQFLAKATPSRRQAIARVLTCSRRHGRSWLRFSRHIPLSMPKKSPNGGPLPSPILMAWRSVTRMSTLSWRRWTRRSRQRAVRCSAGTGRLGRSERPAVRRDGSR